MEIIKIGIMGTDDPVLSMIVQKLQHFPNVSICATVTVDGSMPYLPGAALVSDFGKFFNREPKAVIVTAGARWNLDAVMQCAGEGIENLFLLSPVAPDDEDRDTIYELCRHQDIRLLTATISDIENTDILKTFTENLK